MITWKKHESTVRPEPVDTKSSRTKVYLTKNVEEIEREFIDGEKAKMYSYDEATLTKEEYETYVNVSEAVQLATAENDNAVLEALADTSTEQATLESNQMAIMEALADMSTSTT